MKIRMIVDDQQLTATLDRNPTSLAFAALLPLTLQLEDHHRTEKIAVLKARLPIEGAPKGVAPVYGDIAYYAPWGNLALFYRDFGYSPGLVRLGRFDDGVDLLSGASTLSVRLERIGHE